MAQFLVGIVWAEAWRRYFSVSPRVRAAFRPDGPAPDPAGVLPGELGVFVVLCWTAFIAWGVTPALFWGIRSEFLADEFFLFFPIVCNVASALVLPLLAIFAVHARARNLLFWCLGLWIGILFLAYGIAEWRVMARLNPESGRGFFSFYSARLALAVVFWWYLSTSEKAKSWFTAK